MYHGTARTNWFKPRNLDSFREMIRGLGTIHLHECPTKPGLVMLSPDATDEGVFPSGYMVEGEGYVEQGIEDFVYPELAEGEVMVLVSSGADKLRYVGGHALAIDSTGKEVSLSLTDIYCLAEKEFGKRPRPAEE